jgi:hypothetical protein
MHNGEAVCRLIAAVQEEHSEDALLKMRFYFVHAKGMAGWPRAGGMKNRSRALCSYAEVKPHVCGFLVSLGIF